MISRHGVKIMAIYKCNKCGRIRHFYGSGYRPKKCLFGRRNCSGTMVRKS